MKTVSIDPVREARDLLEPLLFRGDLPEEVRADIQRAQDRLVSYIAAIAAVSLPGGPGAGESPAGSRPAGM